MSLITIEAIQLSNSQKRFPNNYFYILFVELFRAIKIQDGNFERQWQKHKKI